LSNLREFELPGGRRTGFVGPDAYEADEVVEDHASVKVAQTAGSWRRVQLRL